MINQFLAGAFIASFIINIGLIILVIIQQSEGNKMLFNFVREITDKFVAFNKEVYINIKEMQNIETETPRVIQDKEESIEDLLQSSMNIKNVDDFNE